MVGRLVNYAQGAVIRLHRYVHRKPLTAILTTLGIAVGIVFAAVLADTRRDTDTIVRDVDIIQRQIDSPCTYARGLGNRPATKEERRQCSLLLRANARQKPVRVICIEQHRVGIRCPQGPPIRGEVVRQQGSSPSQPSGPSGGQQVTDPPSSNPPTRPPASPGPSPTPPSPAPTAPVPPTPSPEPSAPASNRPVQVTAPGVSVEAGAGGICAGVGGITVDLGDC